MLTFARLALKLAQMKAGTYVAPVQIVSDEEMAERNRRRFVACKTCGADLEDNGSCWHCGVDKCPAGCTCDSCDSRR